MRMIDADALYEKLNKIRKEEIALYGVGNSRFCSTLSTALYEIEFAPTIEERKTGKWIPCKASIHPYGNDVKCSECGHKMGSSFGYKFCPMCGCKMEGEQP